VVFVGAGGDVTADFWIDPSCPWSWVTAQWLLEVQQQRPVEVRWHPMSLAVLNEGDETPEEWRQFVDDSWGPVRVLEAASQRVGNDAVRALVQAIGRRLHVDGRRDVRTVVQESVAECGLPEQLVDLAWAPELDEDVRLSHKEAMALGGSDVGSPILAVPGPDGERVGFYGPVVSRVPRGEEAARLWDGFLLMAGTAGFFELKRTRDEDPVFG
jgi:protein-disulfide isomerase-like protein with CxxC motif